MIDDLGAFIIRQREKKRIDAPLDGLLCIRITVAFTKYIHGVLTTCLNENENNLQVSGENK
jgi:hypothetical protein